MKPPAGCASSSLSASRSGSTRECRGDSLCPRLTTGTGAPLLATLIEREGSDIASSSLSPRLWSERESASRLRRKTRSLMRRTFSRARKESSRSDRRDPARIFGARPPRGWRAWPRHSRRYPRSAAIRGRGHSREACRRPSRRPPRWPFGARRRCAPRVWTAFRPDPVWAILKAEDARAAKLRSP